VPAWKPDPRRPFVQPLAGSRRRQRLHGRQAPVAVADGVDSVGELTSGQIETFLQEKSQSHSPQTLNHLRRFLVTLQLRAASGSVRGRESGRAGGAAKGAQAEAGFLRIDEVPKLLGALHARWRALFATAIYTGLRKGELLGLRRTDLDFPNRLVLVSRSYDRETNKGAREEAVPMAPELIPFLRQAVQESHSDLVFPKPDGSMMSEEVNLEDVLRRALARALARPLSGPGGPNHSEDFKLWARRDSNPLPPASEAGTLSR
jgi:integrase